jgi:hypothetical protein
MLLLLGICGLAAPLFMMLPPSPGIMLPLDMMLPLGMMLSCACRLYHGHVVQANNRNLILPPMDIISSQRGFFLGEVFIHLALNFVTLFQKYF